MPRETTVTALCYKNVAVVRKERWFDVTAGFKCRHLPLCGQIPKLDQSFAASRNQSPPVFGKPDGKNPVAVTSQRGNLACVVCTPQTYSGILDSASECAAVRRVGHPPYVIAIP